MSLSPKRHAILCHKIVCLSNLLLENIDELQPTTPDVLKYKDDLTKFVESLNNELKDTETVQKTTYFQNISNKIDTILRKEFNPEM